MVTGPMPRKPKATRPKANTLGAIIRPARPWVLTRKAIAMRPTMTTPIQ